MAKYFKVIPMDGEFNVKTVYAAVHMRITILNLLLVVCVKFSTDKMIKCVGTLPCSVILIGK